MKGLPEAASNQCLKLSIQQYKKSIRLGQCEKDLLIRLLDFQFTLPINERMSDADLEFSLKIAPIKGNSMDNLIGFIKTDFPEKELKNLIESMNSSNRTAFSRTINRLHENGLICKLAPSETNYNKFKTLESRPFLYGRGKYQKLVGLTGTGVKKARELKSINDKKRQEERKKREQYWKRHRRYLDKKAKNIL